MKQNLIALSEHERRLLARELHDHAVQTLLQLNMQAGICRQYLDHGYTAELQEELQSLESQVQKASHELRTVIADLRLPPELQDSFGAALQQLMTVHTERGGSDITLTLPPDPDLDQTTQVVLLRVVQDFLYLLRQQKAGPGNLSLTHNSQTSAIRVEVQTSAIAEVDHAAIEPWEQSIALRLKTIDGRYRLKLDDTGAVLRIEVPL